MLVIPGDQHEEMRILHWLKKYKTKPGRGEWFYTATDVLEFMDWLAGKRKVKGARGLWRFADLLGRPDQLDPEVRIAAARLVTRAAPFKAVLEEA
jgi:hypothetical protein